MIGIDTNVLVRYLVEDDPEQTRLARAYLQRYCNEATPGYINHAVLIELVWLLGRGYGYAKPLLVATLESLLAAVALAIEERAVVRAALDDFVTGKADFADYLIARKNAAAGCQKTVTFDRKAARHRLFALLE